MSDVNVVQQQSGTYTPMSRDGSSTNTEKAEVSKPVSNSSDATMPQREVTITIGHPDYIDLERDVPEEALQNSGVPRGLYTETEDERQIRLENEYYADPSNYDNRRRNSLGARIGLSARQLLRNRSSAGH